MDKDKDKSGESKSVTLSKSRSTLISNPSNANLGFDPKSRKIPWLNAWRDPLIGVKTYSSLMRLADLRGDGDYKLVAGDINRKLVVFKGANIEWESPLAHIPIAVCVYYHEISKICK